LACKGSVWQKPTSRYRRPAVMPSATLARVRLLQSQDKCGQAADPRQPRAARLRAPAVERASRSRTQHLDLTRATRGTCGTARACRCRLTAFVEETGVEREHVPLRAVDDGACEVKIGACRHNRPRYQFVDLHTTLDTAKPGAPNRLVQLVCWTCNQPAVLLHRHPTPEAAEKQITQTCASDGLHTQLYIAVAIRFCFE